MRFLWRSQIERGQKSPTRTEKKLRRPPTHKGRGSRVLLFILWSLLLGTLVYTLFFASFLLINPDAIQVRGTNQISSAQVETTVRENLSGRWFGILPKSNFLLLRPTGLAENLSARFPLARDVQVTRVFPHGLEIDIREREKIILWCSGGPCYLVTEKGKATEAKQAVTEENQKFVRTITDTSAQTVRMNQTIFSFDLPGFLTELEPLFEEQLDMQIGTEYEATSRFAGELRVKTSEGFRVYLSTDIMPSKAVSALRLLFEKELPPEKRKELEYVDARTENRLYYLLRKGEEIKTLVPPVSPGEEKKDEKKKKE